MSDAQPKLISGEEQIPLKQPQQNQARMRKTLTAGSLGTMPRRPRQSERNNPRR